LTGDRKIWYVIASGNKKFATAVDFPLRISGLGFGMLAMPLGHLWRSGNEDLQPKMLSSLCIKKKQKKVKLFLCIP
jgi:hypothetical protein